jgi:hypothetical protein
MTQVSFRPTTIVSCLACAVALGCGGAAPPAAAPEAAQSAAASKPQSGAPEAPASASTAAPSSTEAKKEKPQDPVIVHTLAERVFAPRVAYMVNYPVSGAKDTADRKCSVKFPEPGEAKAACMEKERGKFMADVLVFEKSDAGSWLTIYRRSGNDLAQMSKTKLVVGDDTPEKLAIKVESEKGWRPIFAGKKAFELRFRDEYSIQVDDPQYGALVYEARIGVLD